MKEAPAIAYTLLILRHGKSSWKDLSLDDHDRPLKKRGKRDARHVGAFLRERELIPDLILTSSAKRARATTKQVLKGGEFKSDVPVEKHQRLYHAEPEVILDVLQGTADRERRVMIVGHNPGLEDLVELLVGEWYRMPTAALAEIRLPIAHWRDLNTETRGELRHLWTPDMLE